MAASEARQTRAMLRSKGQLTLPSEIRAALHISEGDEVEFTVTDSGEVLLRGMTSVPADQRCFGSGSLTGRPVSARRVCRSRPATSRPCSVR
ncbi:MAG: AbrB/MazE/SpoVT family DNA-binding domain-containing protein [Pseudonocardiaceae bacterium]